MSIEDPFFVVKDEVLKALSKTRDLYERWGAGIDGGEYRSAEEQEWTVTELKNSLRSIEWDLEDLEDTVQIVEKNPTKFRIDGSELAVRKGFIESTKEEVGRMKAQINTPTDIKISSPVDHSSVAGAKKYTRVPTADSPHREYIAGLEQQQQQMRLQDDTIDMMGDSMGNIRDMSSNIANELDEQAVMLDDFGTEMDHAESRVDTTVKKIAKVLHLSNDRRQWMAIGTISSAIIIVLFLLIIM